MILDKLIKLGPGGVPHEVVNDVILHCDADGNGTLDLNEFCEIMWTLKARCCCCCCGLLLTLFRPRR